MLLDNKFCLGSKDLRQIPAIIENKQLKKEQLSAVSGGISVRPEEGADTNASSSFIEKMMRAINDFFIRH